MTLPAEAIERLLVEQGVPPEKAHARAFSTSKVVDNAKLHAGNVLRLPIDAKQAEPSLIAQPWPITLRIPWSALVSDDKHYTPVLRRGKPTMILTEPYRAAKAAVRSLARDVMQGRPPIDIPLSLHARVTVPNNHRRDSVNFGKNCCDALSGIVYVDDSLLWRNCWERTGVDVDAPCALVTLQPYRP